MRRLILLRHAKSDRSTSVEDRDRPLNARGRASAPRVGAWLAEQKLIPDVVVCSTAARTQETWKLLAPSIPKSVRVRFEQALYLAEPDEILAVVRALPDNAGW